MYGEAMLFEDGETQIETKFDGDIVDQRNLMFH